MEQILHHVHGGAALAQITPDGRLETISIYPGRKAAQDANPGIDFYDNRDIKKVGKSSEVLSIAALQSAGAKPKKPKREKKAKPDPEYDAAVIQYERMVEAATNND